MTNVSKQQVTFLINALGKGGAERVLLTLAKWFIDEEFDVTIICLTENNKYQLPVNINMIYLSKMNNSASSLVNMLYIPYHAWKLRQYTAKNNVHQVQSHLFRSNYVNTLSKVFGAKHEIQIVNHSVSSRYLASGISGKLNVFLMRHLYPKADKLICISNKMLDDYYKMFSAPVNSTVIYNPYEVDTVLSASIEEVSEFEFRPEKKYLVTVGRLIPLKRFNDIILVLAKLPENIELILLGDGELMDALKSLASELSLKNRVHFLGQVSNPFKFVKQCDLFISTSETEGFPNVLIEAMLCKTAVISTDCTSGPREILAPKTDIKNLLHGKLEQASHGILYPVGDTKRLEEAVNLLLQDNSLRLDYQEKAFERAHEFSVNKIAKVYKETLLK